MNIYDNTPREILCISNSSNDFFDCDRNSPMLEIGTTYNLVCVIIHSWHTEIELEEFPGIKFNSVYFEEIGGAEG